MAKQFKADDKVRILDVDKIGGADAYFKNGDTTHVMSVAPGGYPYIYCNDGDYVDGLFITDRECRYLELAEAKPSKSERITQLESQVAELQAKVELIAQVDALQKPSVTERFPITTKMIDDLVSYKRPPNKERKAVIERAKAFVKDTINEYQLSDSEISFVVDEKKRSVSVTLSHLFSGKTLAKAIAKCAPDDVFNADIGKAIALGRALGLDVSEFENAVKPTEYVNGHIITFPKEDEWHYRIHYRIDNVRQTENNLTIVHNDGVGLSYTTRANANFRNMERNLPIIDDTEAQY